MVEADAFYAGLAFLGEPDCEELPWRLVWFDLGHPADPLYAGLEVEYHPGSATHRVRLFEYRDDSRDKALGFDMRSTQVVGPEALDTAWIYFGDKPVEYDILRTAAVLGLAQIQAWRSTGQVLQTVVSNLPDCIRRARAPADDTVPGYAMALDGLGAVDDDEPLVYGEGDGDEEPDDGGTAAGAGVNEPAECQGEPDRFDKIAYGWYDLDFRLGDPDYLKKVSNGGTGLSFGEVGHAEDKRSDEDSWFQPQMCSGSDYGDCDLVCKSNYRVLEAACSEALRDQDTCRLPWFVTLTGGHGSYGILIHARRAPDSIAELLEGLARYPLLSEDDHSQLEADESEEAWNDWAREDYVRELEKAFEAVTDSVYDLSEVADGDLYEHFRNNGDAIGEHWRDDGGSMYIDVKKIAEAAAESGDIDLAGAKLLTDGDPAPPAPAQAAGGGYDIELEGLRAPPDELAPFSATGRDGELHYYTVLIPPSGHPTKWHGDTTLSRGAFRTRGAAHTWADEHLEGQPYEVREVTEDQTVGYELGLDGLGAINPTYAWEGCVWQGVMYSCAELGEGLWQRVADLQQALQVSRGRGCHDADIVVNEGWFFSGTENVVGQDVVEGPFESLGVARAVAASMDGVLQDCSNAGPARSRERDEAGYSISLDGVDGVGATHDGMHQIAARSLQQEVLRLFYDASNESFYLRVEYTGALARHPSVSMWIDFGDDTTDEEARDWLTRLSGDDVVRLIHAHSAQDHREPDPRVRIRKG